MHRATPRDDCTHHRAPRLAVLPNPSLGVVGPHEDGEDGSLVARISGWAVWSRIGGSIERVAARAETARRCANRRSAFPSRRGAGAASLEGRAPWPSRSRRSSTGLISLSREARFRVSLLGQAPSSAAVEDVAHARGRVTERLVRPLSPSSPARTGSSSVLIFSCSIPAVAVRATRPVPRAVSRVRPG
jgi:hypothetical protein